MEEENKKSPLLADDLSVEAPDYDEDEQKYNSRVKGRLEFSRDERDTEHQEFDGMTYIEYFDNNEKLANSFVGKKTNKTDANYSSGTVRDKLYAFATAVLTENISGGVMAFDSKNVVMESLGQGLTDIIRKTEELDEDEEKKLRRIYELFKQGDIFVQEQMKRQFKVEKTLNNKFDGKVKGVTWQKQLKEYINLPSRDILHGPGVYLGSIKQYFMTNQPHAFTVDVKSYAETAAMFQNWERWKNVPRDLVSASKMLGSSSDTFSPWWSITDIEKDQVEIIRYEDKWNDEFMIFCNGVMMLPVGFPLSAISPGGEYTFEHQGFKIISEKFAYNKSLCMELRNKVAVYDEAIKMAILKNQQSFAPPTANNTGRVFSSKMWFPGKVLHGVDPDKIRVLNEKFAQGVTQGEIAMMNVFKEEIDSSSVDRSFQGQKSQSNKSGTATEGLQIQEQSAMIVSLAEFAHGMLEKKITKLRFHNILKNMFQPTGTVLDEARDAIVNEYKSYNVEGQIPGEGMGRRVVIPTDNPPFPDQIKKMEDEQSTPTRFNFLNVELLKSAKMIWQFYTESVPRKSSNAKKLMFRAMMADAQMFQRDLNIDFLEEQFSLVWEQDKNKLFRKQPAMDVNEVAALANGGMGGRKEDKGVPKPSAENVPLGA